MTASAVAAIRPAGGPAEIEVVRRLFEEYAAELGVDLGFQGFEEEVATLPGAYAQPRGALLLAWSADLPAGCAGVRPLGPDVCELKRLFVRPAYRGRGLARQLSMAVLAEARARDYRRIRLDTLPGMVEAQRLYRDLGFQEIAPYRANPVPGARFMELALTASPKARP
ncbi:MAG TPA: GNAT family N-acetyltransferase [Gemmatimonadales bacterium]